MKNHKKLINETNKNKFFVGALGILLVSLLLFAVTPTQASSDCTRLISFLEEDATSDQMKGVTDNTSEWSNNSGTVNLDIQHINLDYGDAYAYQNGDTDIFSHRGTRGLGCWGGENDEVDCVDLTERIEIEFDQDEYLKEFEIRSLFYHDTDDFAEVADVDLYLDGNIVAEYNLSGQEPLGGGNDGAVVFEVNPAIKVDKIIFSVNQSKENSDKSEFAVARIWLNENIPPTMDDINEDEDNCYNIVPVLSHLGFDDNCALDDGYYQIDSYSSGGWQVLFEDDEDTSHDISEWTVPGFNSLSEGIHTVYFMADDDANNANGTDGSWSWSFFKDTTPPEVDIIYESPTVQIGDITMIGGGKTVTITATDPGYPETGSGVCTLWISNNNGPSSMIPIADGDPEDESDDGDGIIIVNYSYTDDCLHEIDYRVLDCCGNYNPSSTGHSGEDFYVDATAPTTLTDIVGPNFPIGESPYSWFGNCTTKWINTTDDGCQGGAGVDYLKINVYIGTENPGYPGVVSEIDWEPIHSYMIPDNGEDQGFEDMNDTLGSMSVAFNFSEDCWHMIEHWGIDLVGNEEIVSPTSGTKQIHKVDVTPPETSLEMIGGSNCGEEPEFCVTSDTEIKINTNNVGEDPCIYPETFTFFRVYVGQEGRWYPDENGDGVYNGNCDVSSDDWYGKRWYNYHESFTFTENCTHYVEFFAKDPLCNTEPYHNYTFYVDDEKPVIHKDVGTPAIFVTDDPVETYWVNCETPINITIDDKGCCDDLTVLKKIKYDGVWEIDEITEDILTMGYHEFTFEQDCVHNLSIEAFDCLGNIAYDNETFYVDCTPPTAEKEIAECKEQVAGTCGDYYINNQTRIWLNVTNDGTEPCIVPGWTLHYNISYNGVWYEFTSTEDVDFTFEELAQQHNIPIADECIHTLVFWVEDDLENFGPVDIENFYVDNTPPTAEKDVGMPSIQIEGTDDYYVTNDTRIWLNVTNTGMEPCIVPGWTLYYNISYNGIWYEFTSDENVSFTFEELAQQHNIPIADDCIHTLVFWVEDDVCNVGPKDTELFYVDSTPPEAEKQIAECKVQVGDTNGDYYVNNQTRIWLNVTNDGTEPCIVPGWTLHYNISYNGVWYEFTSTEDVDFTFEELAQQHNIPIADDCIHTLVFWVEDDLENSGPVDIENFYVDNTPPTAEKEIGMPSIQIEGTDDYYVTKNTRIWLNVTNTGMEPCIVPGWTLYYNISYNGIWYEFTSDENVSFTFEELAQQHNIPIADDCIHTLVFWVGDDVCNVGPKDTELFYVDTTPPETVKSFVGPRCKANQSDIDKFGLETPNEINNFWLRDHVTEVVINATDLPEICASGVKYLHVELWWDSNGDNIIDTMLWAKDVEDQDPENDSDPAIGKIQYRFKIMEDCLHEIRWHAVDELGNGEIEPVELFFDDFEDGLGNWDYEHATIKNDGQSHDGNYAELETVDTRRGYHGWMKTSIDTINYQYINLSYWAKTRRTGPGDHLETYWSVGDTGIWTLINAFNNDCTWQYFSHMIQGAGNQEMLQIAYYMDCWDKDYGLVDNVSVTGYPIVNAQKHRVDSQPPNITKVVGNPSIEDPDDPGTWWVTMYTPINITAVDQLAPCAVGGVLIEYAIEYPAGVWTEWITYTGNFTFDEGCVHNLSIRATDCLGNREYHNETFIVHGPSGDDNPDIAIEYPVNPDFPGMDPIRYCEDTLEVLLNASDSKTPTDELEIFLWIQGGRHEAPTLWYNATYDEDGLFHAFIDIFKYKDGAQLTLWAAAVDEDANIEFAVPVTFEVCSDTCYDWWLEKGWSSLSLPIDIMQCAGFCSTDVEDVLASIDGMYDWVAKYDSSGYWDLYHVGYDDELTYAQAQGVLSEILTGEMYWINMTEAGRFYTDGNPPSVSILNPTDETVMAGPDEINGTAFDLETGIEMVQLSIYSESADMYWNGSAWVAEETWLTCDGTESWMFDSSLINWDCGMFTLTAKATDNAGCSAMATVTFTIELYSISGTVYSEDFCGGDENCHLIIGLFYGMPEDEGRPDEWINTSDFSFPYDYEFDCLPSGSYYTFAFVNYTGDDGPPKEGDLVGFAINKSIYDDPLNPDLLEIIDADVTDADITLETVHMEEPQEGEPQ